MPTDCITYQNSGYFSDLIIDYLNQKPILKNLYHRFPTLENFESQIEEKKNNFNGNDKRQILVTEIERQYQNLEISKTTSNNIQLLNDSNTFTVTTGHQLNLFTGPLYFLYKIISTINLTKELKAKYPNYNFVPIYWMATEDHDFEEINYFIFKGKKFNWNTQSKGPVGRLSTKGLEEVYEIFSKEIGTSTNANAIKKLFKEAYLHHNTLADATRFLANELFGDYGLVILDADSKDLKKQFIPHIKDEILHQNSNQLVLKTIDQLKGYTIQVHPREINLFYIKNTIRERIILENNIYKINNTQIEFSKDEIITEIENHPEHFSPNVILRPLYQEVILPNLCYIGGGGELAYWLELKSVFDTAKITFPILLLRNSAVLVTEKLVRKIDQLELTWKDIFTKQEELVHAKAKKYSEFPIDFSIQKEALKKQFEYLYTIAHKTDTSFTGAVKAQEAKQIKGLEHLEKRLLKAQKRKHAEVLERITNLQNELFPNGSLQERQTNFSEFYIANGFNFIHDLASILRPLDNEFTVVTI